MKINSVAIELHTNNLNIVKEVEYMAVSAIILAGGESSRFGSDKTFFEVEGRTFIQRVVNTVSNIADQIIVSVDTEKKAQMVREHLDNNRISLSIDRVRRGPAVAIKHSAELATNDNLIIVPTDLPFVRTTDINRLVDAITNSEFSIYRIKKRFTMLFFGCRKQVINRVQNPFRAREFLWNARSCTIFEAESYGNLININTKEMIPRRITDLNISDTYRLEIPSFGEDCAGRLERYKFWQDYPDMEEKLRKYISNCK